MVNAPKKPYQEYSRLYGPYHRRDDRLVVVLYSTEENQFARRTISYPKYLMEVHLGERLKSNETVHHIDKDPLNNDLSNLTIIDRSEHASQDSIKYEPKKYTCPVCLEKFELTGKQQSEIVRQRNQGKSKTGPYCSRSCRGKGSRGRTEISPPV